MAKAILIMDMPESCSKCKFLYEFQGIKKCQLMNVLNNGASKLSQSTFTQKRHDLCPLRELPEKREINHNKNHYISNFWTEAKGVGWNACLDEILK
jgi:hypothetical protein